MTRARKIAITVFVLSVPLSAIIGILISGIERKEVTEHQAFMDESNARIKQSLVDYFKSNQEPQILDAAWASDSVFTVGVKDDGSKRDRLAKYVCKELMDDHFDDSDFTVRVVDFNQFTDNQGLVVLGEVGCE